MTDTLDFPTIDDTALAAASAAAPLAPKTQVAVAAAAAAGEIDLKKIDLQAVALAQFGDWQARAADVNKRHGGVIFQEVGTTKGLASLRAALAETKQVRFDAQNVSKALKSKLATTSKAIGAKEAEIAAAVAKTEGELQGQVDAEESRREEVKRIEAEKATARRQEFEDKVAKIRGYLAAAQGLPSARIQKGIDFLAAMVIGDDFEEFQPVAQKALDDTLVGLRDLLAKTQAAEEAAAERARIAAENERLRQENERIAAELAAQRAELQRQADELAARARAAAEAEEATRRAAAEEAAAAQRQAQDEARAENDAARQADEAAATTAKAAEPVEPPAEARAAEAVIEPPEAPPVPVAPAPSPLPADPPLVQMIVDSCKSPTELLLAHIDKAFDTKFPSQPKPGIEWWADLRWLAKKVAA